MYLTWQVRFNHTKSGSIMLYNINYLNFFPIMYLRQMYKCRLGINVIFFGTVLNIFLKRLGSYLCWLNINTGKSNFKCCCFLNYTKSLQDITRKLRKVWLTEIMFSHSCLHVRINVNIHKSEAKLSLQLSPRNKTLYVCLIVF